MTVYEACSKCRFERAYDEFNPKVRMCTWQSSTDGNIHTTELQRAPYGECGPGATKFELRDTKK